MASAHQWSSPHCPLMAIARRVMLAAWRTIDHIIIKINVRSIEVDYERRCLITNSNLSLIEKQEAKSPSIDIYKWLEQTTCRVLRCNFHCYQLFSPGASDEIDHSEPNANCSQLENACGSKTNKLIPKQSNRVMLLCKFRYNAHKIHYFLNIKSHNDMQNANHYTKVISCQQNYQTLI